MAVGVGSLLLPQDVADAAIPKLRLRLPHDCQFVFTDTIHFIPAREEPIFLSAGNAG